MLYAGLDLSRKRLDVCLLTEEGEIVGEFGLVVYSATPALECRLVGRCCGTRAGN